VIGNVLAGRYTVTDLIGSGGMQHVYRASDSLCEVFVALKVPQQGQKHKKFKNSAVISARINHYNVAKTLDYFEENGEPFLIEELVPGGTLHDLIERFGFIDPHTAARLFRSLSKGLAASHHAGVVHRDLKPSNVVVDGGYGLTSVKITDFGIATLTEEVLVEEIESNDITKTTSGTVKGALPYMAPEMMFRKKGDYVGTEADVWSLAAMMFHLLSGILPFGAGFLAPANVMNGNLSAWPGFMTTKESFRDVARSLQEIIERCLVIDPKSRPTADDLVLFFNDLVYFSGKWEEGTISNMPSRYFGFISKSPGKAFFHVDSVYGTALPADGKGVAFCSSPGVPHDRAFPVIVRPDQPKV
jgi:serine/threonine protein kinase, bacterial